MHHSRVSPSLGRWVLWLLLGSLLTAALALSSAGSAQAIPRLPQCSNNIDDDGDTRIDFPADPGCNGRNDASETDAAVPRACFNGTSTNDIADGDALVDYPNDPGCSSANDNSEDNPVRLPGCADGGDGDGDGKVDYPDDRGCIAASDPTEGDLACSDGADDDGDGRIDFPLDWGCAAPIASRSGPDQIDTSEINPPQCSDGRDNDGDGTLDTDTNVSGQNADSGCTSPADDDETEPVAPPTAPPACSDTIDNDLDGKIDYPSDPGCVSRLDTEETDPPKGTTPSSGTPSNTGQPVAPSSVSRIYPLVSPFPVIRLRGRADRGGVRITLLRVQSPNGTRVTIYCKGRSCKRRKTSQYTITGFVRARAFEKRLRAGTTLSIYVTKPGFTGKYTRFRINKNSPPSRRDRCARSAGAASVACPAN